MPPTLEASPKPVPHTAAMEARPHIAIASSGLGHIRRGIETWAEDLARALRRAEQNVTLFQGDAAAAPGIEGLRSTPRLDPGLRRRVSSLQKRGGWRYGFGSDYQAEQTLFACHLWKRVRRDYDILNVQDPWLALIMERLHRAGLSRPRVILAHGTEEPATTLQKYRYLQHLAPCYVDDWSQHQPKKQAVFAVPNFVDTDRFRPADSQARRAARTDWDLPPDAFVVLSVAAIKKNHKRVDYLIREFADFARRRPDLSPFLVVAGAREAETDEVIALGQQLLGNRVRFLEGLSRERIPDLFHAADVFALASLHEMMPIALLEALASGLPITCNATPTLRWMAGPAGTPNDLSQNGALVEQFLLLSNPTERTARGQAARAHAEATFSEKAVIPQYLAMYESVMRGPQASR